MEEKKPMQKLPKSAQGVQKALEDAKVDSNVVELPASTHTAKEAANTLGCELAEIAKSLVFMTESKKPILVIASGVNRIDEGKLADFVGEKISRASLEFVREKTGFVIGGVAPIAHKEKMLTFIDEDLLALKIVWAAAGTPRSVFSISSEDLVRVTQGTVLRVTKGDKSNEAHKRN